LNSHRNHYTYESRYGICVLVQYNWVLYSTKSNNLTLFKLSVDICTFLKVYEHKQMTFYNLSLGYKQKHTDHDGSNNIKIHIVSCFSIGDIIIILKKCHGLFRRKKGGYTNRLRPSVTFSWHKKDSLLQGIVCVRSITSSWFEEF
jgi:hypothetical protein